MIKDGIHIAFRYRAWKWFVSQKPWLNNRKLLGMEYPSYENIKYEVSALEQVALCQRKLV